MSSRALTVAGAVALDVAFGEPRTPWHPVAAVGRLLEVGYRPFRTGSPVGQLVGGAAVLAAVGGLAGAFAWLAERRLLRMRLPTRTLLLALTLKPTFAIRQLFGEAVGVATALEQGQIDEARRRLRALVSRPAGELTPPLIASAAIESLAENLADSVAAPLLYYVVFGLPGAVIYRVVNTADAMYGYHADLEWLGKAAARGDDMLSWLPSRVSALALVGAATLLGGGAAGRRALKSWHEDSHRTESPNAGQPMAAMAGSLGRRLEKQGHYVLGERYSDPGANDIRMAIRLAGVAAAGIALVTIASLGGRRR